MVKIVYVGGKWTIYFILNVSSKTLLIVTWITMFRRAVRLDSDSEGKSCDFQGISAISTGTEFQRREVVMWRTMVPGFCGLVCHGEVRQAQSTEKVRLWFRNNLKLSFHNSVCFIFNSVQSFSRVQLFVTPWITAHQASLSITNSWSPPKPMSIEMVMPSSRLILCRPLLLPSIFPSIRVFSNESVLRVRWPKYWSFSFSISPSNEHPGLISFRMD